MTTAHKPTWVPAMGKETGGANISVPTRSYSSRDLPGHLLLKERKEGQQNKNDLLYKNFKAELLEKEKKYFREKNEKKGIFESDDTPAIQYKEPALKKKIKAEENAQLQKQLQQYGDDSDEEKKNKPLKDLLQKENESESDEEEEEEIKEGKKEKQFKKREEESINPFPQDADDPDFANTSSDEDEENNDSKKGNKDDEKSSSSESDSDDDEELLMKEYQKIKEQREAEEQEKLKAKGDEIEKQRQSNLLKHNPLLNQPGEYSLKRKWFEDTVFKNQAKKIKEEKARFINDNVRSDFHKKFLKKFIQT